MIFIWGTRWSTGEKTDYFMQCDKCGVQIFEVYTARKWFTIYFIPIIPLGRLKLLCHCLSCNKNIIKKRDDETLRLLEEQSLSYEQMINEQLKKQTQDNENQVGEVIDFTPLEKHSYPLLIKALCILFLSLFIMSVPKFLYVELAKDIDLANKIAQAKKSFLEKDYSTAYWQYKAILGVHKNYQEGKKNFAKTCFALSDQSQYYFYKGMKTINGMSFSEAEIKKIESFLPSEYIEDFELSIERA